MKRSNSSDLSCMRVFQALTSLPSHVDVFLLSVSIIIQNSNSSFNKHCLYTCLQAMRFPYYIGTKDEQHLYVLYQEARVNPQPGEQQFSNWGWRIATSAALEKVIKGTRRLAFLLLHKMWPPTLSGILGYCFVVPMVHASLHGHSTREEFGKFYSIGMSQCYCPEGRQYEKHFLGFFAKEEFCIVY